MLVSTMSCIQGAIMELGVFGCSGMMVFETLWVISHKPVTDISLLPFYFNHRFSIRFQSGNFFNHFRPLSGCFFYVKTAQWPGVSSFVSQEAVNPPRICLSRYHFSAFFNLRQLLSIAHHF